MTGEFFYFYFLSIRILRICQSLPCDKEVIASRRSFVIGVCFCIGHTVRQAEGEGVVSRLGN